MSLTKPFLQLMLLFALLAAFAAWSTSPPARGATTAPGVFAAGDATTVPAKQIVIAMGDGANAALGAFDRLLRSPQVPDAPREAAVA